MNRSPVEEGYLKRIRPGEEERGLICDMASTLVREVDDSGFAKGMVVGSVARNTWISGDRDLDVFMLFDPSVARGELEKKGLALGRDIATRFGGEVVEKYAEHPYVNTQINGFDVDLVPCYNVDSASHIQSAVDRTPFHTRYIRDRVRDLTDDILLLKQFAKSCGVYGSDHMTEGFAGYLCELLVLHYGSFDDVIRNAALWTPGTIIDIENHRAKDFDEPLVVVDPVDPERNVASSLSLRKMSEFLVFCRDYISCPAKEFFIIPEQKKISRQEFNDEIRRRGTYFFAIVFENPDSIPDILVPQLRKSLRSLESLFGRNDFRVLRSDCHMGDERSVLLFELIDEELPPVMKRAGPPVWNRINAEKFLRKHLGHTFSGPYIEGGKYIVEVERRHLNVLSLLKSPEFIESGFGKDVKESIESEYSVLRNEEVWNGDISGFLYDYIHKEPANVRILQNRI
ncbi:CCA tRNA nucleotidyltransferase [Methanolacinia petrolearia]|uniref:CCA tRNA nucleotidyltransferase n=1 Tax=Methanolacinia petrolearia TaxID=54120 RepID=UPI003BA8560F